MDRGAIIIALSVLLEISGCCTPGDHSYLSVTLDAQQTDMWCWAASGQMTMDFIHPASNIQQCDEANKEFGLTDCCTTPVPSECVNGGWPEYDKYGFTANVTADTALSWADLKSQIDCKKKPIAFSWHWNTNGGHMMVAIGYSTVDGVEFVDVNNPWPPNASVSGGGAYEIYTYYQYVGGTGWDHYHWNDYYNITYTGAN